MPIQSGLCFRAASQSRADSPLRAAADTASLPPSLWNLPSRLLRYQQRHEMPYLLTTCKETTSAPLSSHHVRTGQGRASFSSTSLILLSKQREYRYLSTNAPLNNSTSYYSHKSHLTQRFFLFWKQCLAMSLKGNQKSASVRLFL